MGVGDLHQERGPPQATTIGSRSTRRLAAAGPSGNVASAGPSGKVASAGPSGKVAPSGPSGKVARSGAWSSSVPCARTPTNLPADRRALLEATVGSGGVAS